MKLLTTFFILMLTLNVNANSNKAHYWGEDIDVEYLDLIEIRVNTSIKLNSLILTIQEYGGFECEVEMEQTRDNLVTIYTNWFPGADSSGCTLDLKTKSGEDLGSSTIFMSY